MLLLYYDYIMFNNKKDKTMEKTIKTDTKRLHTFVALCHCNDIAPAIAIENKNIIKILEDYKATVSPILIQEILSNEF